jgi:hypothetical protein
MARGGNPNPKLKFTVHGADRNCMKAPKLTDAEALVLVETARVHATELHRNCPEAATGANDHGGREYWLHLDETVEVERRFGGKDPHVLAACWCHDLIEDCNLHLDVDQRRDQLADVIGDWAEAIVWSVTDREQIPDPDNPGEFRKPKNRRERKAATLPETREQPGGTDVKCDDRIANIEQAWRSSNRSMLKMYTKEHEAFERLLQVEGVADAKWQHIRALLLLSDAPAGEGDWMPAGARRHFSGHELNAMLRQCMRGEADELFMPAQGVVYARFGDVIFEANVNPSGKATKSAMARSDEQAAKVEWARMLPAKIDRWFFPIEQDHAGHLSVDQLIEAHEGDEALAISKCLTIINAGRLVIEDAGVRQSFADRSRNGIREGVRRWARQHPQIAKRPDVADVVRDVLAGGARSRTLGTR